MRIEIELPDDAYARLTAIAAEASVSIETAAARFLEDGMFPQGRPTISPPIAFGSPVQTTEDRLHRIAVMRAWLLGDFDGIAALLADHPQGADLLFGWVEPYLSQMIVRLGVAPPDLKAGREALLKVLDGWQGRALRELSEGSKQDGGEVG